MYQSVSLANHTNEKIQFIFVFPTVAATLSPIQKREKADLD